MERLKEAIEVGGTTGLNGGALTQLQSRTWLLHWSLFVYFNHPEGRLLLLESFLSPAYLNTIQTSCPWILRYLAAAAIISRKSSSASASRTVRGSLHQIVKIVQMEEYQYSDPITKFLKDLYVEFDFEGAQKWLGEAEKVLENDFFLGDFKEEFLENARFIVSEAYIRIHQKIDIACVVFPFFTLPLSDYLHTAISLHVLTCHGTRGRNGLSTLSGTLEWAQTPKSISKRYSLLISYNRLFSYALFRIFRTSSPPTALTHPYTNLSSRRLAASLSGRKSWALL